jgi:hypothetical protein
MTVKDYPSMLRFIAIGSSIVMLFCFIILYTNSEMVRSLFENIPSYKIDVKQIPINTDFLFPVIIWFLFSYFTRFHDLISNLFKIRKYFDFQYILMPMANEVGIPLNSENRNKLINNRSKLMGRVFYRYADSTAPKISQHNITEALTNWSLYWFLVESISILLLFLIIFTFMKLYGYALFLSFLIITFKFLCHWFYKRAIKNAYLEIKLIFEIKDEPSFQDIKKEFENALQH